MAKRAQRCPAGTKGGRRARRPRHGRKAASRCPDAWEDALAACAAPMKAPPKGPRLFRTPPPIAPVTAFYLLRVEFLSRLRREITARSRELGPGLAPRGVPPTLNLTFISWPWGIPRIDDYAMTHDYAYSFSHACGASHSREKISREFSPAGSTIPFAP